MSKELRYGILLGKSAVDKLLETLEKSLGKWAVALAYIGRECNIGPALMLTAMISHKLREDKIKIPHYLKVMIALCIARNPKLLTVLEELLISEGEEVE